MAKHGHIAAQRNIVSANPFVPQRNPDAEDSMPAATEYKTNTAALPDEAERERWWWDEFGVLVEHEIWYLPRLADEQDA
ncbi:MAG: hypothetical protein OJJ21_22995 [Ferrovibrio sp.]|uniref:hypothetical protein n=1 Tax=Ferrovibrio sp. TaxID=1917215 RepID=UPI00261D2883|nr:hypothetical protein [Ferrovibrio sp.]MCW0236483.1 hypothetical protein [Ferrovibrio sp.]